MSEPNAPRPPEEQTVALHINKFVPRPAGENPSAVRPEDSPTLIIKKSAAQVVAQSPQPVVVPKGAGNALPPQEMLGAVSYAYAKGVYRSEDLERKLLQDPEMRAALGDEVPDAPTIRRFRRLNRQAILATLENFFRWKHKKAKASPGDSGSLAPVPKPAAQEPPSPSTMFLSKKEAEQRLDEAIITDNMSDEE